MPLERTLKRKDSAALKARTCVVLSNRQIAGKDHLAALTGQTAAIHFGATASLVEAVAQRGSLRVHRRRTGETTREL